MFDGKRTRLLAFVRLVGTYKTKGRSEWLPFLFVVAVVAHSNRSVSWTINVATRLTYTNHDSVRIALSFISYEEGDFYVAE